jgi:hypothetical protein
VAAARALGAAEVHFASDDGERLALAERLGARPVLTDFDAPRSGIPSSSRAASRPRASTEAVTTRVVSADEAPLACLEPAIELVVRMN